MKITSIICTYNLCEELKKAIQSLTRQTLAKKDYEILVVDNASTDGTREVVKQFETEENLRYIFEPNPGLSHARNIGWQEAQGGIIAYLDHDAIACPEWLECILDAFLTVPDVGAVGGKVRPIWGAPRPVWLSDKMMHSLSVLDWSDAPIFLTDEQWLVGANISFPRNLLEEVGGFSADLSRMGKNLLSNDEILMLKQIKARGFKVFYHPQIMVEHLVPANRLRKNWFKRRYYWQGISTAILDYWNKTITKKEKYTVIKSQCRVFRKNPELFYNLFRYSNDRKVWDDKIISYYRLGYMKGIFSLKFK